MRSILGLIGVLAIAVAAVVAWNWWMGNSNQLNISYPTNGTSLAGNTVPVRLSADQSLRAQLLQPGSATQIVTYLDGKEVYRGTDLEYSLTAVAPGEHRLEVGVAQSGQSSQGLNLNLIPKAVTFTLGGGSGANLNSQPPGVSNSSDSPDVVIVEPASTPGPAVVVVPATPATSNGPALPASGLGGQSLASVAQAPQALAVDGSQRQIRVSTTKVNSNAVIAAETAGQNKPDDSPLQLFFRVMAAFYVAGFIVALGAVVAIQRRRS